MGCWCKKSISDKQETKSGLSKYVISFQLSYMVNNNATDTLSHGYKPINVHNRQHALFPNCFFSYGFNHNEMGNYLVKIFVHHVKILMRHNGGKQLFAKTFKDIADSFLSKPFLLDEHVTKLGDKGIP